MFGIEKVREEAWEEEVFLTWRAMVFGGVRGGGGGGGGEAEDFGGEVDIYSTAKGCGGGILAQRNSPHQIFFFFFQEPAPPRKFREKITHAAMITATTWVPKGFAAQFPKRYDVSEEEFARIADMARLQLADAQEDLNEARAEAGGAGGEGEAEGEIQSEDEDAGGDGDGEKGRKARKRAKKKAKKAAAMAAASEQLKQAANEDDKEDIEE